MHIDSVLSTSEIAKNHRFCQNASNFGGRGQAQVIMFFNWNFERSFRAYKGTLLSQGRLTFPQQCIFEPSYGLLHFVPGFCQNHAFFQFFPFLTLEINFRQLVLLAHLILSPRPFQPCVTHACTQKFIFCHIVIYEKRGRGAFGGLRGKSRMEKKFRKKISGLLGCQGTSHLMCACQLKKSVILNRPIK